MSVSQKTLVEAISSKFHVITPILDKVNTKKLFGNFQQICQIFDAAFINSMVTLTSLLPISSGYTDHQKNSEKETFMTGFICNSRYDKFWLVSTDSTLEK